MQVSRSEGGTLLPWPNGSLLSGRLMPAPDAAGALLMLGNYRVRVEVPPNTPMGKVWLEILQREKPGQFRLLSDKQAIMFISEMLQKHTTKQALEVQQKAENNPQWSKQVIDNLPYVAEQVGGRLLLFEKQDGQAQGYVQQAEDPQGFMLHGRLDLTHLGTVLFSMKGGDKAAWRIQIQMLDKQQQVRVTSSFASWLDNLNQHASFKVEGSFSDDLSL